MATFGEPELSIELSIQEQVNIISFYLTLCSTTCILLIIYTYFNILLLSNTTNYIEYNSSIYDVESFSL